MCYVPKLKVSKTEQEVLAELMAAAKASQELFAGVFQQRGCIQDRGLYWALGRMRESLGYLVRLTELIIKQTSETNC